MANQPEPIPAGATIGAPVQEPIPAGATLGEPVKAATPMTAQLEPIPIGATIGRPTTRGMSMDDFRMYGSNPSNTPHTPPHTGSILGDAALGALSGVGGAALETVEGVKNLVNKALPASAQIPDIPREYRENVSGAEKVGGFAENVGEFAAGDAALEGMAKLVKLAKVAPEALALAEKYPVAARLLHASVKSGLVGAGQGAVKGAAEGEATQGTEGGAVGGAIGGGAGELVGSAAEAAAPYAKKAAQSVGIGRDAVDSLTRALRPTGKAAAQFPQQAERALPRLAAANKVSPVTNLDELADAAHTSAQNLWNKEIVPQVQKYANEIIPGKPVADAIRNGVLPGDKDLFEGATDEAEKMAAKFDGDMTLQQASDRLQSLNRKVANLYKLDPASRYAATANNASLEAMEDAANELRGQIYTKLESLGEVDPAGMRKTYGALKSVEQAANKRAVVYGRQNTFNLGDLIAGSAGALEGVAAVASGHPLAAVGAAVPFIVNRLMKYANAPETLIRSAVEQGLKEGGLGHFLASTAPTAVARGIANVAPTVGGAAGSQAGQAVTSSGRVIFRASDGSTHSVPANQLDAARAVDPSLEVITP